MSQALEMLQRVDRALGQRWTDADTVNITPAGRAKLAQLHADAAMAAQKVPVEIMQVVAAVVDDDERWAALRAQAEKAVAERPDELSGDAEHVVEYARMYVAAQEAKRLGLPEDSVARLLAACDQFDNAHLRPVHDYAPHLTDTKARVLAGCRMQLRDDQFNDWLQDIDVLAAKCSRHEYTKADAQAVRGELLRVCEDWAGSVTTPEEKAMLAEVREQFVKLTTVAERHALGPAHLEALEHQWRSYKFNGNLPSGLLANAYGALQEYTLTALRAADTFCWAPQTTQAVLAAADGLPESCAPSVSALGDLAETNRSGWWWFQEPVPVQTTDRPGTEQPVVALLWRYGLQEVAPAADFPQLQPPPRLGLWLQTFVLSRQPMNGRVQDVCIPTLAWIWHDNTTLEQLPPRMRREYDRIKREGRVGDDAAGDEQTLAGSMLFSRFFIAAAAWLRQKIVVESHGGQGIRQAARQLQREHKLSETPRVRVIELRRSQYVKREGTEATDSTGRHLSVRFVVKGFWRQQWYATRKEHAPKYIESYLKGPEGAPLKAAAPTVYVVRR